MIQPTRLLAPLLICLWLVGCNNIIQQPAASMPSPVEQNEAGQSLSLAASATLPATPTVPTPSPAATHTRMTGTALARPQSLPSPTIQPTGTLHLEQASSEQAPDFPADFIYLLDGQVMQWNHQEGYADSFADLYGPMDERSVIVDYSLDASQRWIAFLVDRGITASGVGLYDIYLIDQETGNRSLLGESLRRSTNLQLSPDGKWLFYQSGAESDQFNLLQTTAGSIPIRFGVCKWSTEQVCEPPRWSQDSSRLAWSDESGVWLYEQGEEEPQLIIPGELEIVDVSGDVRSIEVDYQGLSWSPEGRYILMKAGPRRMDITLMAVLDTRTRKVVEVPGTYGTDDPSGRVAWLSDGTLFLADVGNSVENDRASIIIWDVLPAHKDLLVPVRQIDLAGLYTAANSPDASWQQIAKVDHVTAAGPRKVCMVIKTYAEGSNPELYCLDLKYQLLDKLGEAPHDIQSLAFFPDADGVIITGSHGSTLFVSGDGSASLDILSLLGGTPGKIDWIIRRSHNGLAQ